MPDTYEPLGEQGIRAFALVIAKDGTIPSVLWEQMTGAEKYAVFMVAGLIMKAGAPAVGMPGSLANVRALDIAESFVPPPGHAEHGVILGRARPGIDHDHSRRESRQ